MYAPTSVEESLREQADGRLLQLIDGGNQRAFETLMQRYYAGLYSFVRQRLNDHEQARDVVQFVFLQLFLSVGKLQNNLRYTRSATPLKSWLFQVAWNRCVDEKRKRRPLLFCELEMINYEDGEISPLDTIADEEALPEEIAEQHDLQQLLCGAIKQLPPRFRSVVFLRYMRELSFGEIGMCLNMPENTAKTYFQRARPLLRAALGNRQTIAS
jgi:RNA polymerase sigma-70 factor (ECF subfamily)